MSSATFPIEIDVRSVKALMDEKAPILLLDCREPSEYETAHIEGATLIPMKTLPSRLDELDGFRNQRIVVHCHHGGRSLRVTHWLREQGFPQVQNMTGGIDAWSTDVDANVPRY